VPDSVLTREAFCISEVRQNLGYLTAHFFVHETSDRVVRANVVSIVDSILESFVDSFSKLTWMDELTAESAKSKANAVSIKVGYPDVYPDVGNPTSVLRYYYPVEIDPSQFFTNIIHIRTNQQMKKWIMLGKRRDARVWSLNPTATRLSYGLYSNSLEIPAGTLFAPLFSRDVPPHLIYSALGAWIAHAVAHAFDSIGSHYYSRGQLQQWWTNSSRSNYDSETKCLASQLGWFSDGNEDRLSDLNLALTDSIADAALILALRAWKSRKADLDVILPGLQDFTQDQLFFISFARTWSGLIASTPTGGLRNGFHLSARDRVHGVLRNVPEFATSFNCPAGANLNPYTRCTFW